MSRTSPRALVALAAALAACSSSGGTDGGGTGTPTVATVAVSGLSAPLLPGQTAQLTAVARDASGTVITGKSFTWVSSTPSVVTVAAGGQVTAVAMGTSTIAATTDGVTGTLVVTVNPTPTIPVASVTITLAQTALTTGDTVQATVVTKDAQGNVLTGRGVTWSSSQPGTATVSASGVVTAVAAGSSDITATSEGVTSAPIAVTVTLPANLLEQRVLAQQGLAIALASTVLQSQLVVLVETLSDDNDMSCNRLGSDNASGSFKLLTTSGSLPAQVGIYFDAACSRPYMLETVTQEDADSALTMIHIVASAAYTGPTGTALGTIAFDESATNIDFNNGRLLGTVNGLGTYTSPTDAQTVRLGLNCDFGNPQHNIGLCQGGIEQNFPGLSKAAGSVSTLGLDSASTGVLSFTGMSTITSGALNSLALTAPTALSMVVQGGTTYGTTSASGGAANFSLFPPTPTGWSVADSANDAVFTISVVDNTARSLAGTVKRISSGATLASFALDQSGTGTITYSDGTMAAVTSWMLSQ